MRPDEPVGHVPAHALVGEPGMSALQELAWMLVGALVLVLLVALVLLDAARRQWLAERLSRADSARTLTYDLDRPNEDVISR